MKQLLQFFSVMIIFALVAGFSPKAHAADTSDVIAGIIFGVIFSIYIEEIRQFLSFTFNLQIFPEDVYFLNEMPSEISSESILLISIFSIVITALASLFPSLAVTKIEPIKALKYE